MEGVEELTIDIFKVLPKLYRRFGDTDMAKPAKSAKNDGILRFSPEPSNGIGQKNCPITFSLRPFRICKNF